MTEQPTPSGYSEAITELETILGELEGSAVDVDKLASDVQRAATLIAHCRARLDKVEADVGAIVADLSGQTPSGTSESATES